MSFKDFTPEQRKAAQAKSAATRLANKAKKLAAPELMNEPIEAQEPATLADLGCAAPTEDDFVAEILTSEEIEAAKEAGRKRYRDEERAKAKKAALDAAYDEARREAGAMPADEDEARALHELVQVRVMLPTLRKPIGGELPPEPIIIDQRVFVSGRTYTVERHVAVFLVSMMDLARRHINQVDGRSRTYYAQEQGTMIYQGGTAAGGPTGPSFDAIHRRAA